MSPILRRILHGCGTLLAIVGLAFVILRLHAHAKEIDLTHFDGTAWLIVTGLALIYGLANLLLALAWRSLLTYLGASVTIGWTIKTYGISQTAKYIPGNIFHLAGRQALGLAIGLPGWPLAKSAAWELGLITVTSALFSGLALPILIDGFPTIASVVLFLMMLSGSATLLWRIAGPLVARAVVYYAMFLTLSGVLFVALVNLASVGIDQSAAIVFPVIGAYVLAWLAGLVTPGAPAGIGVREMVLLILLNGLVSQAELLLAVLLGRLVTVGGDLVFLGIALAMDSENQPVV